MKLKKTRWSGMVEIKTYRFLSWEIRTIWDGSRSFFVAKDICEVLGISNPCLVCRKLPDDDKMLRQLSFAGQQRYFIFITLAGLQCIVSASTSSNAKEFLYWVSRDVMPYIKNSEPNVSEEVNEILKVTNVKQLTVGKCAVHFSLNLSLPPDAKSLAVLERITGIDLGSCLADCKEKNS